MNILIIEDSVVDALLLQRAIESIHGVDINIIKVSTMKDALSNRKNADAVLLDLCLPDSSPDESIKMVPSFDCPLFIVSGNCDPIQAARAIQLGAAGIILKTSRFKEYIMWASCLVTKGYFARRRKICDRYIMIILITIIGILLCFAF